MARGPELLQPSVTPSIAEIDAADDGLRGKELAGVLWQMCPAGVARLAWLTSHGCNSLDDFLKDPRWTDELRDADRLLAVNVMHPDVVALVMAGNTYSAVRERLYRRELEYLTYSGRDKQSMGIAYPQPGASRAFYYYPDEVGRLFRWLDAQEASADGRHKQQLLLAFA